jgi:hypothetical protein
MAAQRRKDWPSTISFNEFDYDEQVEGRNYSFLEVSKMLQM